MADDNLENQIKEQVSKVHLGGTGSEALFNPESGATKEEIKKQAAEFGKEMARTATAPLMQRKKPSTPAEAQQETEQEAGMQQQPEGAQVPEPEKNPINRVDEQNNKLPGSRKEIHQKEKPKPAAGAAGAAAKKKGIGVAKLLLTGGSGFAGGVASYFIS